MVHEFYRNDAFNQRPNSGVFGRMADQLNLRGFQSATNAAGAGGTMLTGDQLYNNPVRGVTTKSPDSLNQNPTVENIYDIVKELNGVGEHGSSVMSEAWSSRVATGLFEHEEAIEFAQLPQFTDDDYPGSGSLNGRFGAVMKSMKSREYRKVNREFYVVKHEGYDHHGANEVSGKFKSANDAIKNFVSQLKSNGLYDNTVLLMGSDFGRSLNPNSSGGSDHAWGGNYFMVGGSVKGGKIMGRYPQPLTPDHPNWIGRGRFIPTTSWDAVWNGIGQWMGLHEEDELNEAIPNRGSFDTCTELFTDKDLFIDGACTCSKCETVTWPPTALQTSAPTTAPRTIYEAEVQTWDSSGKISSGNDGYSGIGYANMGGEGSWVQFNNVDGGVGGACTLGFLYSVGSDLPRPCSLTVNDVNIGSVTFSSTGAWDIREYDYVETSCLPGNNVIRITASTGEGGPNLDRMDLLSAPTGTPPPTNQPTLPVPTNLPTFKPTNQPTTSPPTNQPTTSPPTNQPTTSPPTNQPTTLQPTNPPTSQPTSDGEYVENIFSTDSYAYSMECVSGGNNSVRAFDKTTEKYACTQDLTEPVVPAGIVVHPSHEKMSVAQKLRVYAHNNCPDCDVVSYILSGRVDESSDWVVISQGDLPWRYTGAQSRNDRGKPIESTYESGDIRRSYTEVLFEENTAAFLHYRVQFPEARNPDQTSRQFAEVELPGILLPTGTTAPPTSSPPPPTPPPTTLPTANPTKLPTPNPSHLPTNAPVAPTPPPISEPTPLPTANPVSPPTQPPTALPTNEVSGTAVNTVFGDVPVAQVIGMTSSNTANNAFDHKTSKFWGYRDFITPSGFIVSPTHGQTSVAKKLRVYAHNNCPACDAITYKLSGRTSESSDWVVITEGDLPWRYYDSNPPRNDKGLPIASTYESGDPDRSYTEVFFEDNSAAFLEYMIQFPEVRNGGDVLQFGELELPGLLLP